MKINVDASFKPTGMSMGLVARNHRGSSLLIWQGKGHASLAMDAELQRIHRAIWLARQKDWKILEIEGNCKVLLEALSQREACPYWQLSSLFLNVELSCYFTSIKFIWIPRRANTVAHSISACVRTTESAGFPTFGELPNV